jgi:hypothetical protein
MGKELTFQGTEGKYFSERRMAINGCAVPGVPCFFIGQQYVCQCMED